MKFTPVGNRVLVKRAEAQEKTAGGLLYVPPTAQEKLSEGVVVAIGKGTDNVQPAGFNVGDKVYFEKYAGNELKVDDVDHVLLKFEDIIAVIE